MVLKPVGYQKKKELPDLVTYWQNKSVDDADRDITKGSIHVTRLPIGFSGIVYLLQDDPSLMIGSRLAVKDVTIRLISYGLNVLRAHSINATIEEILKLDHDINVKCSRVNNIRRWTGHTLPVDEITLPGDMQLFTGTDAKGFIDDINRKVGLDRQVIIALLFYIALEKYDFTTIDIDAGHHNDVVKVGISTIQDALLDRLVILRGCAREFYVGSEH